MRHISMAEISMNRREWGVLEAGFEDAQPFEAAVEMHPPTAQVCEPLHLSFTISPVEAALGAGTDLLVAVPRTWKLDLNGAFPEISKFFAVWEGGYGNGRQCFVAAEPSAEGVQAHVALIPVGFEFLIHVHLEGGALPVGERLRIHLAHPDGTRVRAPQTVQFHPFTTALRPHGTDAFRPLSTTPGVTTYGGYARSLRVTTQAVTGPDGIPSFKIVPMDQYDLNRAFDYGGEVTVSELDVEEVEYRVSIGRAERFTRIEVPITGEGPFHYVQAQDLSCDLIGRSNPVGSPEHFGGYRVFFGDLHSHCRPCDGFGTMQEAYDYAYEISELDFASVSHQQNSMNFPFSRKHWQAYLEINEAFNRREDFATLPICENYSSYGHRHALFRNLADAERFPVGHAHWGDWRSNAACHPDNLWATLEGTGALTFPHHMKFIHGTDFSIPPNRMEPVMEICSRWGISEIGGEHSAQYALSQGRRMGFIGGTDNQLGQPGSGPHGHNEGRGWTAVLAKALGREAIFDAIRARRCYATTGAKILLYVTLGEHLMGEEVLGWEGDRVLQVRAAGTRPIDRVEVIRNGEVVYEESPGAYTVETTFCDSRPLTFQMPVFSGLSPFCYYYVRITQRDQNQAWSSPIWIEVG